MTLVGGQANLFTHPVLEQFHPAVRAWFVERFPDGPTPPQLGGWPAIAAGQDTLIAAPTGSGKTLSGFLVGIDQLYRAHAAGETLDHLRVLYVSPLRALAVDIKENLEAPLAEIAAVARRLGFDPPDLRVAVRTGDTTTAARAAIVRKPPHLLVTTPESLYLLLTAARSRLVLAGLNTVIIDEIHALAKDKRGTHLALSLERLEHITRQRPVRIGLSATQKPIETVARLLVGNRVDAEGRTACAVVDSGHQRHLDLAIELPDGELEAIGSAEQMGDQLDRIAELVSQHRTTLVFVNTRRMAERVAHLLGERLGEDAVASHHGSLSKDRRARVEQRLRAGELRALVATASLELGIDIGPVELVCQLGSPRSLATFLQRVGRSGHSRYGTPKGHIFPLTRDELIECSALLIGVRAGRLDALHPPVAPLDILLQQIVAEAATERWSLDDLYRLVCRADPYRDLTREQFDEVVELAASGVTTGRGPRGDHLHLDRINGEVSGRRGARLAALTSGGAIPELADYRVIADPEETLIGTVNEDWAIESMPGDVFLLGTNSWRIRRIEPGVVRVIDAGGADPTVPFWLGESPGRTTELSEEVSRLRGVVDAYLAADNPGGARAWLRKDGQLPDAAAVQIINYLAATRAVLGLVPTRDVVVIERFFDDTGGMQLVLHCPYGARINRGLGLALRKRFCVSFDFELQAAASDDAVVLSLGPQHSFPLESVIKFLRSDTVADVLRQAVLVPPSPMFVSRWRWNLNRSLTVLRWKGGRKNPPAIQRMEADDIMAAVFPQAAACQENAAGPIQIPDHPLVLQTMHDTLTESMDISGLEQLLASVESGRIQVVCRDTVEPSPMSHEILVGKPYTFLDDGEAADRRTRAVSLRRGLPVALEEIGGVDPSAIDAVVAELIPDPRNPDELHDLLMSLISMAPKAEWVPLFEELRRAGRAVTARVAQRPRWCPTEAVRSMVALFADATDHTGQPLGRHLGRGSEPGNPADPAEPADLADLTDLREIAAVHAVRGLLDISGPATAGELAYRCGLPVGTVTIALAALQSEGFAISGHFGGGGAPADLATAITDTDLQWCARRVLARIHYASQRRQRRSVQPVNAAILMRMLLRWQHVHPDHRLRGDEGLLQVIEQLQGWHAPAGAWEQHLLSARIDRYKPELLDRRGHAGEVTWAKLAPDTHDAPDARNDGEDNARRASRVTPLTLCTRADLTWLLRAARGEPAETGRDPAAGPLALVLAALERGGARFPAELSADTALDDATLEAALWDGVARGLLHADSFWALRSLFEHRSGTGRAAGHGRGNLEQGPRRRLRRGAAAARVPGEGRWALLPPPAHIDEPDELAEAVAEQLLCRWGVVFRDLVVREALALPWREIQWALRRLEARGTIRGGRFVTGFSGEQYALPEALELLKVVRRTAETVTETGAATAPDECITVSAADPLNLTGVLFPGPRTPAVQTRCVHYINGVPQPDPGRAEPA
ncbi:MAG: DEAD/DEAH box helicase [Acidimicrobiales bacterium]